MNSHLPKRFSAYLISQSLGALNDNFFKMLLQLYVIVLLNSENAAGLISQANLVFTLPFVLFGPWAGYIADRFAKSRVLQVVKVSEIGVMAIGVLAFYQGSVALMLAVLFLMATQSTFFGPAKYGYIPEQCEPEAITAANSWVGMTTFVSIIIGTAVSGLLLDWHRGNAVLVALYTLIFAAIGSLVILFIRPSRQGLKREAFPLNPIAAIRADLIFLKRQKPLFLAALANSYFWMTGLIFQTNILIYGKHLLAGNSNGHILLSLLPALMGIGIAAGSLLARRWSGMKVELGLVPLGGLGLALTGILLFWSTESYTGTSLLLFFGGVCGGLYTIPLISFIQYRAGEDSKGRVLAASGVLNGLFLVLGTVLHRILAVELALAPQTIFLLMGVLTIGAVGIICRVIPDYFVRFCTWLLTHTLYRIRVEGAENVPHRGPVLLAPNHVSYTDALMITASLQRFIRFVMLKSFYDMPLLHHIFRLAQAIPIDPQDGRNGVQQSLAQAHFALQAQHAVCIFPEGRISRSGEINPFRRGCESILQGLDCPVIPVYIHNPAGSFFKQREGKWVWQWPRRLRLGSPMTITFGTPLPSSAAAGDIEAAVRDIASRFAA